MEKDLYNRMQPVEYVRVQKMNQYAKHLLSSPEKVIDFLNVLREDYGFTHQMLFDSMSKVHKKEKDFINHE